MLDSQMDEDYGSEHGSTSPSNQKSASKPKRTASSSAPRQTKRVKPTPTKRKTKDDIFNDPDRLFGPAKSPLYKDDMNIQSILQHPDGQDILAALPADSDFDSIPYADVTSAIKEFKDDGSRGKHDETWIQDAYNATLDRKNGRFDEYLDDKFLKDWGNESEELSSDEDGLAGTTEQANTADRASNSHNSLQEYELNDTADFEIEDFGGDDDDDEGDNPDYESSRSSKGSARGDSPSAEASHPNLLPTGNLDSSINGVSDDLSTPPSLAEPRVNATDSKDETRSLVDKIISRDAQLYIPPDLSNIQPRFKSWAIPHKTLDNQYWDNAHSSPDIHGREDSANLDQASAKGVDNMISARSTPDTKSYEAASTELESGIPNLRVVDKSPNAA